MVTEEAFLAIDDVLTVDDVLGHMGADTVGWEADAPGRGSCMITAGFCAASAWPPLLPLRAMFCRRSHYLALVLQAVFCRRSH